MPSYRYRAARADGRLVSGKLHAGSAGRAGAELVQRGLHPVELAEADCAGAGHSAASRRDLATVFRSLASLAAAGVPLDQALGATQAVARGELAGALARARSELREGRTLAQALAAAHGAVPGLVIGMLAAGERGSRLGHALEQVAHQLEREAELAARVRHALAYPTLLAIVGTGSVLVLGGVVVPRFAGLLQDLGADVPATTRLLMATSQFLGRHGLALVLAIGTVTAAALAWAQRPAGRLLLDRASLRLPLLGPIRHALASARMARTLAAMLQAGMPLLPALHAVREAAGNGAVAERLARARERVAEGAPLAAALERERVMVAGSLQLVAVGEASGQLAVMAERAGDLAAQEADRRLTTLVSMLEPVMILAFGGLVALVAAALLQAVYSLRPGGV